MDNVHHDLVDLQVHICSIAKGIITDILEVAELEDQAYDLKLLHTDLNELILKSVERYKAEAYRKKITVNTTFDNRCFALINPDKFLRMFDNLIFQCLEFFQQEINPSI